MEPENLRAKEMEDEDHGDLIDSLSHNLFDHVNGEQRIHLLVGLAIKLDLGMPGPSPAQGRQRYP